MGFRMKEDQMFLSLRVKGTVKMSTLRLVFVLLWINFLAKLFPNLIAWETVRTTPFSASFSNLELKLAFFFF